MERKRLTYGETRLMQLVWDAEPVPSGQLIERCRTELGWQKSTGYTMLKKLADRGGVTGLNLVPEFLNDRNLPGTVAMLMEHVRHIVCVAGEDVLGIGSDLDGFSEPSEISCASQVGLLFSAMEKEFTPRQIEKFASGNVLRVLADQ